MLILMYVMHFQSKRQSEKGKLKSFTINFQLYFQTITGDISYVTRKWKS